ncbi:hypothetical protein [Pseudomonas sp. TE50-2]
MDGAIAQAAEDNVHAAIPGYLGQGPLAVIRLQNVVDAQMP